MRRSEDIGELAAALAKAQGEMPMVPKGASNTFFGSNYADLADVVEKIKPHLSKHGLAVVQMPETIDGKAVSTTMLLHSSGQWLMGTLELTVQKNDMQALGSATTYARRYQYSGMTGAVADSDDDGNAAAAGHEAPVTRSTGTQPGSRAAKDEAPKGPKLATDAQWTFLAGLTKQTVEEARAQYGELNMPAMRQLIDSLKGE